VTQVQASVGDRLVVEGKLGWHRFLLEERDARGVYVDGGATIQAFLRAGLITEHTPGTVARLDAALHRADAPFSGVIF
jgi:hypothetical protein